MNSSTYKRKQAKKSRPKRFLLNSTHQKFLPWQNWGKTASCTPEFSFFPTSIFELVEIMNLSRRTGKKLRVVAQGHSWSSLVPTDDILVYISRMNKVEMDTTDLSNPTVILESGATIKEVNDVLEANGYALPFNVVLESVRFGGLVATGSHGSGWGNATLSDLVAWIEIIDANGHIRRFEEGKDSEEVMNAARLHLGMFGITYRMALKVNPTWRVEMVDQRLPLEETIMNIKELVLSHDSVDFFWWPFSKQIWMKHWNKTKANITAKPRKSYLDYVGASITSRLGNLIWRLSSRFPRLTPALSKFCFLCTPSKGRKVVDIVEAVHYRRCIEVNKMGCVEIAFKIDPEFENVKQAFQLVREKVDKYAAEGKFSFNVTLNLRFVSNSACWLSPAYGPGHTCYIEILSKTKQEYWDEFSADVATEWLKLPGAKPHWAKEFQHIPGVIDHIKKAYEGNIERFNQIKEALKVDPEGRFVNTLLQKIFIPNQ